MENTYTTWNEVKEWRNREKEPQKIGFNLQTQWRVKDWKQTKDNENWEIVILQATKWTGNHKTEFTLTTYEGIMKDSDHEIPFDKDDENFRIENMELMTRRQYKSRNALMNAMNKELEKIWQNHKKEA